MTYVERVEDQTKVIPRPDWVAVDSSPMVPVKATYLGPTDHRGSRIRVSRMMGSGERRSYGRDRMAVTVGWQCELNSEENYANAVRVYLERAGWTGRWSVASYGDDAVAVWVGRE